MADRIEPEYVEEMKQLFLAALEAGAHSGKDANILNSLAFLIEADGFKPFFAAMDEAKAADISVPEFLEGLMKFQSIQICMLLSKSSGDAVELQESLTLLFALNLRKSLQIVKELFPQKDT